MALKAAGVSARGVDTNTDMVAVARERGLDVTAATRSATSRGWPVNRSAASSPPRSWNI